MQFCMHCAATCLGAELHPPDAPSGPTQGKPGLIQPSPAQGFSSSDTTTAGLPAHRPEGSDLQGRKLPREVEPFPGRQAASSGSRALEIAQLDFHMLHFPSAHPQLQAEGSWPRALISVQGETPLPTSPEG